MTDYQHIYKILINISDALGQGARPCSSHLHLRDSGGNLLTSIDEVARTLAAGTFMGPYYGKRIRARQIIRLPEWNSVIEAGAVSEPARIEDGEIVFRFHCGAEYGLNDVLRSRRFELS